MCIRVYVAQVRDQENYRRKSSVYPNNKPFSIDIRSIVVMMLVPTASCFVSRFNDTLMQHAVWVWYQVQIPIYSAHRLMCWKLELSNSDKKWKKNTLALENFKANLNFVNTWEWAWEKQTSITVCESGIENVCTNASYCLYFFSLYFKEHSWNR